MEPAAPPEGLAGDVPGEGGGPGAGGPVAPPSRRAALLRTGFVALVLFIVFGVILPRFIDYDEVVAAFRSLTLPQVLLMTAMVAVAWVVSGLLFSILVERLAIVPGTAAYLILSGIGASVPLGPWNMGVLWVVLRGWGIGIRPATSGIALYGVVNELGRLATPLLAVIVLAFTGGSAGTSTAALIITIISTVVLVVATSVMFAIVRSDRAADWVARTVQRVASWVLRRLGRPDTADVKGGIGKFRDELGELLDQRGIAAMLASVLGQVTWCIVMIAALRIVGITSEILSPGDIFAVFAMVSVITIIPIAPGGAAIPELLYIAFMTAIAGPEHESLIAAGVILFRLYQWFLPIPISWILLKAARRGRSMLPSTVELRAYAHDETA
jgi:uncharacterized membrane protein YbhN (UPF0104 family)